MVLQGIESGGACCSGCAEHGERRRRTASMVHSAIGRSSSGRSGVHGLGEAPPLASQLQALVRALPACPTGRELLRFMNAAAELAAKGFRIGSAEAARARQLLGDAINSPASIGISIPFFPWSDAPTYCAGAVPRTRAINLATAAVAAASGDIGWTTVQVEAVKELASDLKPPVPDDPLAALKWVGIGAAALGGAYVVGKVASLFGRA